MFDYYGILDKMWQEAVKDLNFNSRATDNELEVSRDVLRTLRNDSDYPVNFSYDPNRVRGEIFRGLFGVKLVYADILPSSTYTRVDSQEPVIVKPVPHLALKYEKKNGRIAYIDWEHNQEHMK